jgi:endo-1,4-beta-xylanase
MQLAFQQTVSPYTGMFPSVDLTNSWQQFTFPNCTRPNSDSAITIQLAMSVGKVAGTYYFDDIQITDEGKTVTPIPNDWYEKVDERIAQYRKGDFSVAIQKGGVPVPSCSVKVTMDKGEFLWGTALTLYGTFYRPDNSTYTMTEADQKNYRDTASKYFQYGTMGNVFKWSEVERSRNNPVYTDVDNYLKWADSVKWDLRGHTLIWGRTSNNHGMPAWTQSLSNEELYKACSTRVVRDVAHYKGKMKEYDVINEPLHEKWLGNKLGESIYSKAFKWARQADPDAELYINEFNILEYSEKGTYRALIERLIADGAPIDGIGLQGHFTKRIAWQEVAQHLQYIADAGLPVKITECDITDNTITAQQRAEDYATIMRIAFSHPSVKSFIFWGFWAKDHWRPDGAMFNEDWSKRAAADTVYNLIHNVWTTKLSTVANGNGLVSFNGFNGTYSVSVKEGSSWKTVPAPVVLSGKGTKSVTIDIESGTVGIHKGDLTDKKGGALQKKVSGVFTDNITVFSSSGRIIAHYNAVSGVKFVVTSSGCRLDGANLAKGVYVVKADRGGLQVSGMINVLK